MTEVSSEPQHFKNLLYKLDILNSEQEYMNLQVKSLLGIVLIPALRRQRQKGLREFKATLLYLVGSRPAKAT